MALKMKEANNSAATFDQFTKIVKFKTQYIEILRLATQLRASNLKPCIFKILA